MTHLCSSSLEFFPGTEERISTRMPAPGADPEAELAAQGCVGQIHPPLLDHLLEDGLVVVIQFVFR